ncbi:PSD1 and planctomycete cytochrome C domain-containing protein [Tuwongella immobilis]|uniref:Cytochrome c domain-containing protein n=1 Tax=Tuwongella immobilis TaxID=692036 RepID=A0A6C2YNB8_9BACT|nr:PSD1 and planctomycete cytochrome C domain-containing protein [Tuwongella immobilis]VIP03108.1 protein containing duf1549 : Uncharacterized protein OS=Singulisphaera acidiphila (strain ATCC BAA-1392 / DSM 18658 / VKM B-2454 / MOB10) GN=Sinac_1210 PE=4 SV=1: PSCyt1: PSCyt2: PSD1 [Tuwongella immobilis]VTS03412.1 protein containing duf1549 : Uncharacterized protein OS=Singulisphaera acidiphila (strain ATCC BAA-1392 / DSM 18658 / VKM B-2454 / MOB10) GN=Sinac_1210 PE=4 SV=1: PSCyt1: PSCyt2: PSD1 [T
MSLSHLRYLLTILVVATIHSLASADPKIDFFEAKIRPVLIENCFSCHAEQKQKGGLRVDSLAALIAGGDSGTALVPGKPDSSLIIQVLEYSGDTKMPPRGKLGAGVIADFTTWIRDGAVWPKGSDNSGMVKTISVLQDPKRLNHWSFQPIQNPKIPNVTNRNWSPNPIDQFILEKLEKNQLTPAKQTDRATLLRRLTFTLTGLPPSPEEIRQFEQDQSPDAVAQKIVELMNRPTYGERWARHWMDLVRYAETYGHEFDFTIPEAWKYRDYLIRAFQQDIPYSQLIREHLAGDLLENPRLHPDTRANESILGTGFWHFGEAKHSPVDVRQDEAERIDNQLDVFSKTFLALTLSCARCHDHKFDPIPTKDYYALTGILQSSRYQLAYLDDPKPVQAIQSELRNRIDRLAMELPKVNLERALQLLARDPFESQLLSVFALGQKDRLPKLTEIADQLRSRQDKWKQWRESGIVLGDFRAGNSWDWHATGHSFPSKPNSSPRLTVADDGKLQVRPAGWFDSGEFGKKLEGDLRSPTFEIQRNRIWYRVRGHAARINLILDGLRLIQNPIYGGLTIHVNHGDQPRWIEMDVAMWKGHRAYVEILDSAGGSIAIEQVIQADGPPPQESEPSSELLNLVQRRDELPLDVEFLGSIPEFSTILLQTQIREANLQTLHSQIDSVRTRQDQFPTPNRGLAMLDGTPEDDRVHIRGNHKNLGAVVPRRSFEIFDGASGYQTTGSGRLELANRLASGKNPLIARVIVNRVWHYHFGVGLVPTTDDFGIQGQSPTHPELLDWLASWFMEHGWSIKKLHSLILTSQTFQMQSVHHDPKATQVDPLNRVYHRMPIRRLEAEAIRDSLLAISGRLDLRAGGPSVEPHLTDFMVGRGRPSVSGPLDGNGRRSIYLGVRRNFLNPWFLAFDYPSPFSTMGRRTVSNVPAQALAMLNNPFVHEQSKLWAQRMIREIPSDQPLRIQTMWRMAFGKAPTPDELQSVQHFLDEQRGLYGKSDDPRIWEDLAHVMVNSKNFIFIP